MTLLETTPEFSRTIEVGKIPAHGMSLEVHAKPEEREALSRRLGLLGLESLSARLDLAHGDNAGINVSGDFTAQFTQQCVITLESLPKSVAEPLSGAFVPEDALHSDARHEEIDDIMADTIDPIIKGRVDLGELVTQHLALAVDPYPRKPDAALPKSSPRAAAPAEEKTNPFAVLAGLVKEK